MEHPATADDLSDLLQRHADLEAAHGDGEGGTVLSGWQCENPWIERITASVDEEAARLRADRYLFLEDDPILHELLLNFHQKIDGKVPESVIYGAGSSTILFTLCAWLHERQIQEVFYIPPLYFTLHWALRLFGIRARAVSARHTFEAGYTMNLPDRTAVLLLSDPVWYAGMPVPDVIIDQLVHWQRKTQSTIFTDGSFQYSRWTGGSVESTTRFDPQSSVRLICPSKALAAHGYRFAYAELPCAMRDDWVRIHSNIYGSAPSTSAAFARTAMAMLLDNEIPAAIMNLVASRHSRLREEDVISAPWQPNAGYFVFEMIRGDLRPNGVLMDGTFFQQRRYTGYNRINLLSPSIHLLG
jgi:aspartate/methionine/tyrosine aminotransferase